MCVCVRVCVCVRERERESFFFSISNIDKWGVLMKKGQQLQSSCFSPDFFLSFFLSFKLV